MVRIEKAILSGFRKAGIVSVEKAPKISRVIFTIPGVAGVVEARIGNYATFSLHDGAPSPKRFEVPECVRHDNLVQWLRTVAR